MNIITNDHFQGNLKKLVQAHKMYSRYMINQASANKRINAENNNVHLIDADCKINKQDLAENCDLVWLKLSDKLIFKIKSCKKINFKQHILSQFSKLRIANSMSKLKNAIS